MFVRVIRKTDDGDLDAVYECDHVRMKQNTNPFRVIIEMEGPLRPIMVLELDKESSEIYYMNNAGQTIDKYVWNYPKPEPAEAA